MFPVMSSASKINGILFIVLLFGMFLYSLPLVFGFASGQSPSQAMAMFLDGKLVRKFEHYYDKSLFLRDPSIELWADIQYALFREGASGVVLGRDGWLFTNQEYLLPGALEENLDKQLALIEQAREQLTAKGMRLILLPIPMKLDTYAEHARLAPSAQLRGLYADFRARLSAHGIASADLRSAYQQAAAAVPLFLRNDTHWTPQGADLAARTLAVQFPELAGNTPYLTQAVGEKQVPGDLLNYLKFDPRLAPSYFEPVHIALHETLKASSQDLGDSLFNGEAVSLALVGTSYTQIEDWNFIGFLKQALQRDLVSVALEARGPFEAMNTFLASPAATSGEVQTVVWEFPLRTLLAQRQLPSPIAQ